MQGFLQKQRILVKNLLINCKCRVGNAGKIKYILTTATLQYFRNFKFKMEAQVISQSSVLQNSQFYVPPFESSEIDDFGSEFDDHIRTLLEKGLSVFVFEEKFEKETIKQFETFNEERICYFSERILTYNRKSKSLEELSKKFIDHFQGKGNNIIQLDKITAELCVERRRIYDVINILESLNVIAKKGKNNYEWRGLCEAVRTISQCQREGQNYKIQNFKKQKSLEYLAGGFLKLFITWKPAISLEEAAKLLMKQMDEASVKTKIRRLYDIINVFRSLGLVRKASLPSRKPGYEWAGTQYLEHLIMKKQYCEENTGLNELNNEYEIQNPEEPSSSFFFVKGGAFSPFVCPQPHKSNPTNFKLSSDSKETRDQEEEKSDRKGFNQELFVQTSQFPIFRKTNSAFTLVADGNVRNL